MNINTILMHHFEFEEGLKNLIRYGLEIVHDELHTQNQRKSIEEKRMLLESLLLRTCALWESFIEKELVYVVHLNSSNFKENFGLPLKTNLNYGLIRAILYSDKYQDFHDIETSRKYFKKILSSDYNPFIHIRTEQIKKIKFSYILRNYLSHYSDYSKQKLTNAYKREFGYKKFIEPGSFLLIKKGKNFQNLTHNFILVSVNMQKSFK